MAAPPIIMNSSRPRPLVEAAESVCRPGAGPVPVAVAWLVRVGCTTVTAVTVLRSPLGRVVVLL